LISVCNEEELVFSKNFFQKNGGSASATSSQTNDELAPLINDDLAPLTLNAYFSS